MRVTDYNAIADTYDRRYSEEDYDGIERALVDFVADMPRDVLEVGCGTGHWLQGLSAMRFQVVGVDVSQRMLSKAKSKLETGRLVRGCAEHLPFANDTFERIFCINAHHHFLDKPLDPIPGLTDGGFTTTLRRHWSSTGSAIRRANNFDVGWKRLALPTSRPLR